MQSAIPSLEVSSEIKELLIHVLDGYEVIYEKPIGFARDTLLQIAALQKQRKGGALLLNPFSLLVTSFVPVVDETEDVEMHEGAMLRSPIWSPVNGA